MAPLFEESLGICTRARFAQTCH